MWSYILRRILIMVPVVGAMMIASFILSRSSPNDPVFAEITSVFESSNQVDRNEKEAMYRAKSAEMGMDMPMFYLELSPIALPDTLHRILFLDERASLRELTTRTGNWEAVSRYYHDVKALQEQAFGLKVSQEEKYITDDLRLTINELTYTPDAEEIAFRIHVIDSLLALQPATFAPLRPAVAAVHSSHDAMTSETSPWKSYVPSLRFHGFDNQFHHWLMQTLRLDFGNSTLDFTPVKNKILNALPWSIFLGLSSYLISFFFAVRIGLYSVRHRRQWQDKLSTVIMFLLKSIPSFVLAMLLMTFLCNPAYLHLFPVTGVSTDGSEDWPLYYRIVDYAYHLVLPTLVFAVQSTVILSRQMRVSMLEAMESDYVRTARAKGLAEKVIIQRHVLRNSLVPLINAISHVMPQLVMGAVFVETIFSLPGMGKLITEALFNGDHPTVVAVFSIAGLLTVIGMLLGDILYAMADPRISFSKQ